MALRKLLARVALLDGIPPEGLARLGQLGEIRRFPYGTHLTVQGQTAGTMYVIAKGRVRVERSHPELREPVRLGTLGPGAIVGQEGLVEGQTHSVTATTLEDTEALELTGIALATISKFPKVATSPPGALSQALRTGDQLTEQVLMRHARRRRSDPRGAAAQP